MAFVDDLRDVPELAQWLIGEEIGRGGMGVVYAATDQDTGEPCALKIITTGPDAAAHVRREIENSRQLEHPNIVRTHAGGLVRDIPYMALELCAHGNLAQRVREQGPLPADQAVSLITQVLAGLEYAHAAPVTATDAHGGRVDTVGLVHRDVKPQNILLAGAGDVAKVADFGLAKAFQLAGLSGLTRTGSSAGTPAFMPRQQVIDFKYATPAVDVWAAAASLYFALTAHTPRDFRPGKDPWLTAWRSRPVPLRQRGVPVPDRLATLLDEALADDPDLRFGTATELRAALEAI
ncbi:serine/threonine protein kinase [Amycolatopsis rhizosphaerae]|uniref:non-specific serine/threonine protein kinase n=1 Tax=Amycolatopsis rhizosphaerae TaxID=2053003 RepID=A0A558D4B3_9PSEU|nr:serine/threonine-protein kinase [Amycolatopsis rhizosphaerae]TVT55841.1 serine/threonine protein kinase [Amycolatopsis rhizosphaerae]